MTTIEGIYTSINPLPAMLAAKGKAEPRVRFEMEANAGVNISFDWAKRHRAYEFEREYKTFLGDDFDQALTKAIAFINELPSAEQAKLHEFMGELGKLIDAGKSEGISVDYMNPLLDTMKRLSENVITYKKPKSSAHPSQVRGTE